MEYRLRVNWLGGVCVLAGAVVVSVITSTVVASRAYLARVERQASAHRDISVKGSARVRVQSDLGEWRIVLSGEASTLDAAYERLDASSRRVAEFLRELGFGEGEVTLGAIETSTHYARDARGYETREVEAHTLSREALVRSADVRRVAEAAGRITELLREGVRVRSSPPTFTYTRVGDTKIELAGLAAADARARAERIAREAGARIVDVRDAQMGIIQITPPDSTEVSSYGLYDTSTIEKDVSVVVTLTLGLESAG